MTVHILGHHSLVVGSGCKDMSLDPAPFPFRCGPRRAMVKRSRSLPPHVRGEEDWLICEVYVHMAITGDLILDTNCNVDSTVAWLRDMTHMQMAGPVWAHLATGSEELSLVILRDGTERVLRNDQQDLLVDLAEYCMGGHALILNVYAVLIVAEPNEM